MTINSIRSFALILLICFVHTNTKANYLDSDSQYLDSMNRMISNPENHDTTTASYMLELIGYWYTHDPDSAISIGKMALMHSVKHNYQDGMANSYGWLGYLVRQKGDVPLALDYFHKSLKIYEKMNELGGMAVSYNNIGLIHKKQGDVELALKYYGKCLELDEKSGNRKGLSTSYLNIGSIYDDTGEVERALEYYNKSVAIQKDINDLKGLSYSLDKIAYVHLYKGNLEKANDYYLKSLKIKKDRKDIVGQAESYYKLATVANRMGKIHGKDGALELGNEGLRISQEIGYPEDIQGSAAVLYLVYKNEKQFEKALEMRNLEVQMKDSIDGERAVKATTKEQAKYEYEKAKAVSDKDNEKKLELERKENEIQRVIIAAVVVGLLLVVTFLIFVFSRLRLTRKQKQIIEEQKLIVDESNEELNQTNEEILAQRDQIENQRAALQHKNEQVEASISYAKRIQEAIMPSMDDMNVALKNGFVLYLPKDIVAGDFFWMELMEDEVFIAAADCTGHGVPGALVSVVCSTALTKTLLEEKITDTGKILDRTREIVIESLARSGEEVKDGMDISLCKLNLKSREIQWSGANNPFWFLRNGSHEMEIIKANKQPIGVHRDPKPFASHNLQMNEGDSIYLVTDGFQDQFGGPNGNKFMARNLRQLIIDNQNILMDDQKEVLNNEFKSWMGNTEQIDDVCVIGIRIS